MFFGRKAMLYGRDHLEITRAAPTSTNWGVGGVGCFFFNKAILQNVNIKNDQNRPIYRAPNN